jgi:hypothetical protein
MRYKVTYREMKRWMSVDHSVVVDADTEFHARMAALEQMRSSQNMPQTCVLYFVACEEIREKDES